VPWGESGTAASGSGSGAYDLSDIREHGSDDGAPVLLASRRLDEHTLAVDVIARNVSSLYGAEISIVHDPEQLQLVDASYRPGVQARPGAMWASARSAFVAMNDGGPTGSRFAAARLSPAVALEGDQVIKTMIYQLRVAEPDDAYALSGVELVSSDGERIPTRWTGVSPRDGWSIALPYAARSAMRP
jgi:hypothetical protein